MPATATPVSERSVSGEPYGVGKVLAIWAAAAAPMGLLGWVVAPLVMARVELEPGIVFWLLMTVGMMWQFALSALLLRRECPDWSWGELRRRLWLTAPRATRPGDSAWTVMAWVLLGVAFTMITGSLAAGLIDAPWRALLPHIPTPEHANITNLISPRFKGAWWLLPLFLVSSLFNYFLGEELLFRGVLLPKMQGAFGRWAWLANAVLFGLYHVHYIDRWPSMIVSSLPYSAAAQRFRSAWLGAAVHGGGGVVIFGILLWVIIGGPE